MRSLCVTILVVLPSLALPAETSRSPIYLWLEPEWFDGVEGNFAYWTGEAKPAGSWGVAGPGISAEWSQGGESEWNSMGAPADETKAACSRNLIVPRAGKYRLWVRYVDHRQKAEPFAIRLEQQGRVVIAGELGVKPVVPPNDEYMLYWGFSFGWDNLEGELQAGEANLSLLIEKKGEAWRQVDAVLLTDDRDYTPVGREKPPFDYTRFCNLRARGDEAWRGTAKQLAVGGGWKRPLVGGRDFSMWTQIDADPKWWGQQKLDALTKYDLFFQFSPPQDIRDAFHKQHTGRKDLPILSWPDLLPGFYLGASPDLSPDAPARKWLERTKTPFCILTNYAGPQYTDKTGPATYQALTGPLADQFLGYVHGEAIGSPGVSMPAKPLAASRSQHVDALGKHLTHQQAKRWTDIYKTQVPEEHWAKGISCLSCESIALAHLFHEMGAKVVGYEEDATNVHVPMRIAFERGAARQYGGAWINYASGNFGDACNYFTQNPVANRGAGGWFHSKYAVTDGVSIGWYRKMYYLNYLGGASAVFWEQGLGNQWMQPGPGKHPIQLSPFGRATVDFQDFVKRLPDRGEPFTPIAILLSHAHGYERVNYRCKMLDHFRESPADRELRELFNVCWHPSGVVEGEPAAPDVQSLPNGIFGNVFDVLVDRPERLKALFDYPVVIAAGDVDLGGLGGKAWPVLEEYVKTGGTLVINSSAANGKLPAAFLGVRFTGQTLRSEAWQPADEKDPLASTPFLVHQAEPTGARVLVHAANRQPLITRNQVGDGAVILTLCPRMMGLDERAHPALPYLLDHLSAGLVPVQVRVRNAKAATGAYQLIDGRPTHLPLDETHPPTGEILYQFNRTKNGWIVLLVNNSGIDKTQNGIARVNRRQHVDVVLRTRLAVKAAREYTQPRELAVEQRGPELQIVVRVHPGDVQVVELVTAK